MKKIIDLRKMFKSYYEKELEGGLCGMLSSLGMKFEGNEHSGIDDARNILRVFYKMVEDGCRMEFNTDLKKHKAKRGKWFKMRK